MAMEMAKATATTSTTEKMKRFICFYVTGYE